jgi:hypothetical protein
VRREPGLPESGGQLGHRAALRRQPLDAGLGHQPDADLHGRHGQHRRCPHPEALDVGRRLVHRAHRELVALTEPPLDRGPQLLLEVAPHVEEGRRARAAVEVLVGAADGQVGVRGREPDRHGAGGVRQVPEHEGTGVVHLPGDRRDVGQRARPVGHRRQDDDGDPAVQRGRKRRRVEALVDVGRELADGHAECLGDAGDDVAVGREVVGRAHQHVPAGAGPGTGHKQLVEVDRRRVGDEHLAGSGAQHSGGQGVAEPGGLADPVRPRADQLLAPLLLDHARQSGGCLARQPAEGVPVQVDQPVGAVVLGAGEAQPEARERIGRVQGGRSMASCLPGRWSSVPPRDPVARPDRPRAGGRRPER